MDRIIFFGFCIVSIVANMACTRGAQVELLGESGLKFVPADHIVEYARPEPWKVGRDFATKIDRGFVLGVTLPELSDSDAELLWSKRRIDSWYLRLFRLGNNGHESLLQVVIPYGKAVGNGFDKGSISNFAVNVHYAAASLSTRLSNLQCPAMNHRKVIENVVIREEKPNFKVMTITAADENPVSGKVEPFSFGKFIINGGMTLKGTYSVEIAFFSTIENKIKSSAIGYPQVVVLGNENEIDIPGCANSVTPPRDENADDTKPIDKFKFGR